ncbi:hypothetical protein DVR12_20815 [Chitinophaga silvatica]|uniref:Lipocalin-like domain-containing protein n=1 Tax=Chitinophaga silvatica TaxID=2282649 RepID=A0A3E1Y5Y6_9BACT|nr:lipocalin family protein [Chitinophaga silvatica]RFS20160.1 hypothetical protein DVR12_20815 [Chitinophaga silvatica]
MKSMNAITMKWFLLMIPATILLSCKKEKSESESKCNIDVASLSGTYKVTSLKYTSKPDATPVDFMEFMEACEKDDIITLKKDGTYEYFDLGVTCSPNGSDKGTWELNGKTLISDGKLNGTVSSFDCKTLVYYVENSLVSGDKFVFTMVRQ